MKTGEEIGAAFVRWCQEQGLVAAIMPGNELHFYGRADNGEVVGCAVYNETETGTASGVSPCGDPDVGVRPFLYRREARLSDEPCLRCGAHGGGENNISLSAQVGCEVCGGRGTITPLIGVPLPGDP